MIIYKKNIENKKAFVEHLKRFGIMEKLKNKILINKQKKSLEKQQRFNERLEKAGFRVFGIDTPQQVEELKEYLKNNK